MTILIIAIAAVVLAACSSNVDVVSPSSDLIPPPNPADPYTRHEGVVVLPVDGTVMPEVDQGAITQAINAALDYWRACGLPLAQPGTVDQYNTVFVSHDSNVPNGDWALTQLTSGSMPRILCSDSMYRCLIGGTAAACNPAAIVALAHEIGHAMGLMHVMSADSVMNPNGVSMLPAQPFQIDKDLADCLMNTVSLKCSDGY